MVGGKITASQYHRGYWEFFQINSECIKANGGSFYPDNQVASIPFFRGARSVSSLPVRPVTPEEKERLIERGRRYSKYGVGIHYMSYRGALSRRAHWNSIRYKADGRVVIDGVNCKYLLPKMNGNNNSRTH